MSLSLPFAQDNEQVRASEALLDAASIGRVEALKKAIADGGNPNYVRMDSSPCFSAVFSDHLECTRLIIEAGGGADQPNRFGWTALHEAARKEDVSFLEVILASEFEQTLTCRDKKGWTALHSAVDAGRPEAATQLLIAEPALIDIANRESVSPIMMAARARNEFMMELLLSASPDLTVSDLDNRTLSDYVADWPDGQALLARHDANPPAPRTQINTKAVEVAPEPEVEAPEAPANPFGLGGMKKMKKGP